MKDIRDLEDFHFRCQQGMYFSEYLAFDDFLCLFSEIVEDNYWNYTAWLTSDLAHSWPHIQSLFKKRNRVPSIYVSPTSDLYEKVNLLPPTFSKDYSDAWMVLVNQGYLANYKITAGILTRKIIPQSEGDKFVKVFDLAYKGDSPDDPYGNLPVSYSNALKASFQASPERYTVEHYLAEAAGSPVGVATAIFGRGIAGVYNVGTIKEHRKSGVGTALMQHIFRRCSDLNIETTLLQTEQGSDVEKWYVTMGFKTIFIATCYSEKKAEQV